MLRSYRVFTSSLYRLIMFVIYPLTAILCCYLVQSDFIKEGGYTYLLAANLMIYGFVMIEVFTDYWAFSGIHAKKTNHMDFFKVSKRGKKLFRQALIFDAIRRLITFMACSLINVGMGVFIFHKEFIWEQDFIYIWFSIFFAYILCTIGVFITRFGSSYWLNLGVAYLVYFAAMILCMFTESVGIPQCVTLVGNGVVSVLLTVGLIAFAMKKVEDSYYDK